MKLLLLPLGVILIACGDAPDPVHQVAAALSFGASADACDRSSDRLNAARSLAALGARPADGDSDLIDDWRADAAACGSPETNPPMRGRALGPAYRRGEIAAGAQLATEQVFLAGKAASIAVVPGPGRQLMLRVTGPDGEICPPTPAAPRASCRWMPVFTRRITITLENRGTAPAPYYLVSN